MPNLIQARAKGFLDLLGAKTGLGPKESLDYVSPTLDMFQLYAADRYQISYVQGTGGIPLTAAIQNTTQNLWLLDHVAIRTLIGVGTTSLHARVFWQHPSSTNNIELIDYDLSPPTVITAGTNHERVTHLNRPLPFMPGSFITFYVDDLQGAAGVTARLQIGYYDLAQ
jgi:hypothetical protein